MNVSNQKTKRKYRGRPKTAEPNHISCLDWNFDWHYPSDFEELQRAWNDGFHYEDIARALKRPTKEVVALIMDEWEKGNLSERPNGIYGRRKPM